MLLRAQQTLESSSESATQQEQSTTQNTSAVTVATVLSGDKQITEGTSGETVTYIQERLNHLGLICPEDGNFSGNTVQVWNRFVTLYKSGTQNVIDATGLRLLHQALLCSVDQKTVSEIMPHLGDSTLAEYLPFLNQAMYESDISNNKRKAAFLAQLAHESGEFRYMEEIASGRAYEGRSDLGNTQPGDGVRYKGRGPIQLTGRANYRKFGAILGLDLEGNPEQASRPDVGFRIAAAYWADRGLNEQADAGNFTEITRRINGGQNGRAAREAYHARAQTALANSDQRGIEGANGLISKEQGDIEIDVAGLSLPDGVLRKGNRGSSVLNLQKVLLHLGCLSQASYRTGPGIFGSRTEAALQRFQAAHGLLDDGVYGPKTRTAMAEALNSNAPPQTAEPAKTEEAPQTAVKLCTSLPQPTLERGLNGVGVSQLQNALIDLGYMTEAQKKTGPGVFGPMTQAAVKAFQADNNIGADGVYGPYTATVMAQKLGLSSPGATNQEQRGFSNKDYDDAREAVLAAARSHLGAPYYWGGNGPANFDCSGFVLYVLRNDTRLINWGDDTAAGISNRVKSTTTPSKGDLVFYSGSSVSHIEIATGNGSQTIGASGGNSHTRGDNPNAKVKYGDWTRDSRRKSFGSIEELIQAKKPRGGGGGGKAFM